MSLDNGNDCNSLKRKDVPQFADYNADGERVEKTGGETPPQKMVTFRFVFNL